jgi:hypothetical protein
MNSHGNAGAAQTRDLTISDLIYGLTLPRLWSAIGAIFALIVGSFYLGLWSTDFFANRKMIKELQFKNQFFETYLRYAISTDPELRPANISDALLASEHDKAMSDFVDFIKRINDEQHSNRAEEQKANVFLEKGQDQSIAVLHFNNGAPWSIPQQIKLRVHGIEPR